MAIDTLGESCRSLTEQLRKSRWNLNQRDLSVPKVLAVTVSCENELASTVRHIGLAAHKGEGLGSLLHQSKKDAPEGASFFVASWEST